MVADTVGGQVVSTAPRVLHRDPPCCNFPPTDGEHWEGSGFAIGAVVDKVCRCCFPDGCVPTRPRKHIVQTLERRVAA